METLYIIGFFAVVFVIVLIVGFIGNKAVDGAENALRSKRYDKRNGVSPKVSQQESLAARYSSTPAAVKYTNKAPADLCRNCGARIPQGSAYCPSCGTGK